MTDVRWRAVLAPIGVPADRRERMYGLAKAVGLAGVGTPPEPLPPVLLKAIPGPAPVGVIDELVIDGDPQVLRAGGYLADPPDVLLDMIRRKVLHVGFDLADVVGMGPMVMAATFQSIVLIPFDHPVDPYAVWRPETFTATFELVDDQPAVPA